MAFRNYAFAAILLGANLFAAEIPSRRPLAERLKESHLEAVHEARVKWMRDRVVLPPLGIYNDYRAILHVHAEDAEHTKGTRQQVLDAAKETDVKVIMWTDHRGPKPETWHGMKEGVLFIPGSEDGDHKLRFPKEGDDLLFFSHIEEIPDRSPEGYQGMEIYNRHADAILNPEMTDLLKKASEDGKQLSHLAAKLKKYPDELFAAGTGYLPLYIERWDRVLATRQFTGIAANDAHRNVILKDVVIDPYELSFRNVSTHILARELKEDQIRASLREGHVYVAHDWLCDPTGFALVAGNNYGNFDIGDRVPLTGTTRIMARFPVSAHAKIYHKGSMVFESTGTQISYTATEEGAYRLEAWLTADGEERPWIYTNPVYLYKPAPDALKLPPSTLAPNVRAERGLVYVEGKPEDEAKHKLDLYLPAGRQNYPLLMFVHGGNWRSGDRSMYAALGNRFAKAGIGVAIPSYRLAPKNPPPAQIEDVAAAFAWTVKHAAEYGADPKRVFLAGHSAGGHLVAELALDGRWLAKHELTTASIKGVAALSGVYDVSVSDVFGADVAARRQYSPMAYVAAGAPRFLIAYCQWDYAGLATQAKAFDAALRKAFVESSLEFIPGESHISEIVNIWKENDPIALAVIRLISP